jgi:hypothetical protein
MALMRRSRSICGAVSGRSLSRFGFARMKAKSSSSCARVSAMSGGSWLAALPTMRPSSSCRCASVSFAAAARPFANAADCAAVSTPSASSCWSVAASTVTLGGVPCTAGLVPPPPVPVPLAPAPLPVLAVPPPTPGAPALTEKGTRAVPIFFSSAMTFLFSALDAGMTRPSRFDHRSVRTRPPSNQASPVPTGHAVGRLTVAVNLWSGSFVTTTMLGGGDWNKVSETIIGFPYLHAAFAAKSQHGPALPLAPLLVVGAPLPAVPPGPGVPGVNISRAGAMAGAFA